MKREKTDRVERFEFRTTAEFLAKIDAVRGHMTRAAAIQQLCEIALKPKTAPAPSLFLIGHELSR